ncbi:hypothetical protein FGIG_06827 [Fasciola gigantica]|uniref:SRR1-like domain-containing protein n=1 Tax=Fasciola gigantica TaxID=46835 RepID=A0A504Z638_FASGI|nr:hypothetical protein FGIG_06827 [Fasciola gigantica]
MPCCPLLPALVSGNIDSITSHFYVVLFDTSENFLICNSFAEFTFELPQALRLLAGLCMEGTAPPSWSAIECNTTSVMDDADDQEWIRAGSHHRKKCRKKNKQHKILRCSAAQRPDGCRPPSGLADLVADDDLDTLRTKFHRKREYFVHSHPGRLFLTELLASLDRAIREVTPNYEMQHTFDVLCLGLGNPAVDQASLSQLAVLDLLLERDSRLTRSRTQLYDPLFRSVSRSFILELGMQILGTNEEACYPLALDRHHFVMLPHCAPALVNNLLYTNWDPNFLGRVILFSNSWSHVRRELSVSGEPEYLIAQELACIYALESIIAATEEPSYSNDVDFEGMRIQWFPACRLAELPSVTWNKTKPIDSLQSRQPSFPGQQAHPKTLSTGDYFYADLISRDLISTFLDSP